MCAYSLGQAGRIEELEANALENEGSNCATSEEDYHNTSVLDKGDVAIGSGLVIDGDGELNVVQDDRAAIERHEWGGANKDSPQASVWQHLS